MHSKDLSVLHDSQLRENRNSFKINTEGPENPVNNIMAGRWMNEQGQCSTRNYLHFGIRKLTHFILRTIDPPFI